MATSGSFRTSAYDSRCLEFAWSRKSYSFENNTTTISWTLYARGTGQYRQYNAGNFRVKIDGVQVYYSESRITTTDGLYIAGGEYTFTHNNDGSKSFTAYVEAGIYTYAVNCSGSGTFTLDSIPRKATLTTVPAELNDMDDIVIGFSNPLGNSVSSLKIYISLANSKSNSIVSRTITNKTTNSYIITLTESEKMAFYNNMPTTTWRDVYVILETVVGSTAYEDSVKRDFFLVGHHPTATITIRDNNPDTTKLTGNSERFIKGQSTAAFTITGTARKGATITKYFIDGNEVNATDSILNISTDNITYAVEDSRGLRYENTVSLTMIDYVDVTCGQKVDIKLESETIATITVSLSGDYFNGSFGNVSNELWLEVRHRETNGQWSNWIPLTEAYTPTYSGTTYKLTAPIPYNFDYSKAYTIESRARDKLSVGESPLYTARLTPVFDWGENDFNFNVPISFNGQEMKDFIVERGTSGIWTYRKWNSGIAECWGTIAPASHSITTAWGAIYTKDNAIARQSYPFQFVADPVVSMTLHNPTGNCWAFTGTPGGVSQTPAFGLARGTSGTATVGARIMAIGRWK